MFQGKRKRLPTEIDFSPVAALELTGVTITYQDYLQMPNLLRELMQMWNGARAEASRLARKEAARKG